MTDLDEARGALTFYDENGFLDNNDLQRIMPSVRWALEALANGVEPDYEAAAKALHKLDHSEHPDGQCLMNDRPYMTTAKAIVDAAVGGRLLVDPPKEEE